MLQRNSLALPVAKIIAHEEVWHQDTRTDNYFWLRDRKNTDVIEYIESENYYTEAMMEHTKVLQEKLYQEFLKRIKETDVSVPEKIDDYYYYIRTEQSKQYPIYCRKKGDMDATEEILIDQNILAREYTYFRLGYYRISPNHRFLAYTIDTAGLENYTLYIKDLASGKLLDDKIPCIHPLIEWANDNETIFYTLFDQAKRPYQLYRHLLGAPLQHDTLVYHEKDETFFVFIRKTKSNAYLLMNMRSKTSSEVRYVKSDSPRDDFKIFQPRQPNIEYYIAHHKDRFFIMTNENARNFKIMETSVFNTERKNWKEVIPHHDSVKIDGIEAFKDHLVIYKWENGLKNICIKNLVTEEIHDIKFPEAVYTFYSGKNEDFNTPLLRFTYTSLVTPESVYDYHMDDKTWELKKQDEVFGYDPSLYVSDRIFAKAADGTMIPVSLVYRKGVILNGQNPLLLHGYGAYGVPTDPEFSQNMLSLLDRGFIYAIAHVRGGGEMGKDWHDNGKLLNKKNTFTDFIACAEHMIAQKYTSSHRLVIWGRSAGGLLIGAVTNMRPDLFKISIAGVPFVDVLNTMLDPSLPLTVTEYEEWGNPRDKRHYDYIKSYSPYDNIQAQNYPHMFISAGLNDTRVQYWEPVKFAARLRALKTDENVLLLKVNMGSGHIGASGRYDALKDTAFEYAFILDKLQCLQVMQ